MGREVRRVTKNWEHPKRENGSYIALFDGGGYLDSLTEFLKNKHEWDSGNFPDYASEEDKELKFEDWYGEKPDIDDYMPVWKEEDKTHLMMYESTSEGTPISPAFETPEELATWLYENKASAFAGMTASYESWLRIANGGYACSAVMQNGKLESGVEALTIKEE